MSTISPPTNIPSLVSGKLSALRRSIGFWLTVAGLSRVLLALLPIVFIDMLLDRSFRMDVAQRGVCLVIMIAIVGYLLYRKLILPLSKSLSDDVLCLEVERRHGQLGQSLISAVQFSRMSDIESLGVSRGMVEATITHGTRSAGEVDFGDVLNRRTLGYNLLLAFAVAAVFVATSVRWPGMMKTWANRNLFLGADHWPHDHTLKIVGIDEDGFLTVPRGDDLTIVVDTSESVVEPEIVTLDHGTSRLTAAARQMEHPSEHRFTARFKNVLQPFQFRAVSSEDWTDWVQLRLIERPKVESVELYLTPPEYTTLKQHPLPPGEGPYRAYPGSQLTVAGRANKPLSSARLEIEGRKFPMPITDGTNFGITITADQFAPGDYEIHLTDTADYDSKHPVHFSIKGKRDLTPVVDVEFQGIRTMIVPGARIPIKMRVRDDFAVQSARLSYAIYNDGQSPELADDKAAADTSATDNAEAKPKDAGAAKDADAAKEGDAAKADDSDQIIPGKRPFDRLGDRLGKDELEYLYPFDVTDLKLEVGKNLAMVIQATDNDTVSGPKVGNSKLLTVRVVTEEELRADLLRREKEQSQQLRRLIENQMAMKTDAEVILADSQGKPTLAVAKRKTLIAVTRRQSATANRYRLIANQVQSIVDEFENNRLKDDDSRNLRENVIAPLNLVADKLVPDCVRTLESARRAASRATERDEHLSKAILLQTQIQLRLSAAYAAMIKSEGFQELVNLITRLEALQDNVNRETLEEIKRRERELFEGKNDKQ